MMESLELQCPACDRRIKIAEQNNKLVCSCGKEYPIFKNIIDFLLPEKHFYEEKYQTKWISTTRKRKFPEFLLKLREKLSMSTRRERFFRKHLQKGNIRLLDLACGYGRKLFTEYGKVIGLDIVLKPLFEASKIYEWCIRANAFYIPVPDEYFDFVVSSDFIGHIPIDKKDELYKEIHRILKPDGKMIHIIETDSTNWHFRFAHKYPELFRRYFIEEIGGHYGLEMPSQAVERIERNGFKIIDLKKIWGTVWQIQEYKTMFDNEYKTKSIYIYIPL